jgi:hypothetical protein
VRWFHFFRERLIASVETNSDLTPKKGKERNFLKKMIKEKAGCSGKGRDDSMKCFRGMSNCLRLTFYFFCFDLSPLIRRRWGRSDAHSEKKIM